MVFILRLVIIHLYTSIVLNLLQAINVYHSLKIKKINIQVLVYIQKNHQFLRFFFTVLHLLTLFNSEFMLIKMINRGTREYEICKL